MVSFEPEKKFMKNKLYTLILLSCIPVFSYSQNSASEDSLISEGNKPTTYLGGYGNFFYQYNDNEKTANINLERFVMFFGHRFNDKFSFFSELEVEDAKVSGGEEGGEVALEQAYVKFNTGRKSYFTAGLFLPRIGILNENHLPNTFNGNERTLVETYIIPSTWRELGIGYYTSMDALPVEFTVAIVNGLNSLAFEHGSLIREGRYEGRMASANSLAATGSALYSKNNFSFQVSLYSGGSVGLAKDVADTLDLDGGPFGTPVILAEADAQYKVKGFTIKALATTVSIPDAEKINDATESINGEMNGTPKAAYGLYAEASYDFFHNRTGNKKKSLILFARYEKLDMNSSIPSNIDDDPTLDQSHVIAGISYLPIPNIAIKGDVRLSHTAEFEPGPLIDAIPYDNNNTFINLGVGFSF
jgi:hypothetical protein